MTSEPPMLDNKGNVICKRCHRRLTNSYSISIGIGPICQRHQPTSPSHQTTLDRFL